MESTELREAYKYLSYRIAVEGFDYCFTHYSDWGIFKELDPHLFKLIKAYKDASNELASYLDAMEVHDDGWG